MTRWILFAVSWALLTAGPVTAQPTIDGNLVGDDASYGSALSVQNTDTQFGDAEFRPDPVNSGGGSEIDQVFGTVEGGRLYVLIAGNLESNFNKLVVFIDSVEGGNNTINGPELPGVFDSFCGRCGGGLTPARGTNDGTTGGIQNMNGLTFDTGFTADFLLAFTHGNENVRDSTEPVNFWAMSGHYADLTQGTAGAVVPAGIILAPQGMPNVLRKVGEGFSDLPATPDGFDGDGVDTTMYGPALPNLHGGEIIDRDYALTHGGCQDDTGAGCISVEMEFVLDVDPSELLAVAGDYNADGVANAADYVVWRDNLGKNVTLPGANPDATTPGLVDEEDFDFWVANFGNDTPSEGDPNGSDHRNFRNEVDLEMAIDNSNNMGVDGLFEDFFETVEDPTQVITGVEFSIPLSEIGNPTSDIKITAFVNGSDYDFASNQFSGEGILNFNLGSDGDNNFVERQLMFDLSSITGAQFVTIPQNVLGSAIPEPSCLVLIGVACGSWLRRRRC